MTTTQNERNVFIALYDSLKPHKDCHDPLLNQSEYIGRYATQEQFDIYQYGISPAVLQGGNTSIRVDIYAITPEELEQLDEYEKYPMIHDRFHTEIPGFGMAWLYVMSEGYASLAGVYQNPR
ncbi:MAG: hypothetical protein CENE_03504 [Candidatus Celerinatantimonas neptuna]|nr:MAG: hypothetical protein CENE_03504 [Candidatus Celerinatantimonas neptuna]